MDAHVFSLPLTHPSLSALRDADIMIAGIDERRGKQDWGEGLSSTHLLFVVTRGRVESVGSSPRLTACSGQLLVVPAGSAKWLRLKSGHLEAVWFHLHDRARWQFLRNSGPQLLSAVDAPFLLLVFRRLLRESLAAASGPSVAAVGLLAPVLRHYLENFLKPPEGPGRQALRERLERLWQEVGRRLDYAWTIERLAELACLSPTHLHRRTVEFFGVPPLRLVTRLRMERATALLRNSDLKLAAVARQLGYRTAYAFSDAFERHTGQRPGVFRRPVGS